MKARAVILLTSLLWLTAAFGQSDYSVHVKEFPGITVGQKVANAQPSCAAYAPAPCILILDASLASFTTGTMPTLCANCSLVDYRQGGGNTLSKFINGIPQADQFAGADFCVKLRAANVWALANGYSLVDATHFPAAVTCSVDPLQGLNGTGGGTAALAIEMPASKISSAVPWTINNSGLELKGRGRAKTILAYTGVPVVAGVLTMGDPSYASIGHPFYTDESSVYDMSIIGGSGNATDGLVAYDVGNNEFERVSTWGVTGCGVHLFGAVTTTLTQMHTAYTEAARFGYLTGHSVPTSGLCLDQAGLGNYSTDGTVADAVAEGVSGVGFNLIAAQGFTFTSGTSESNGSGVLLSNNTDFNTFTDTDIEGNVANSNGVDVNDTGYGNSYKNVIAISACSGCSSVLLSGSSDIPNAWEGGKFTSIGGTQGVSQGSDDLFGTVFKGFGTGALAAAYDGTSNGSIFNIYAPNITAGYTGMCIGFEKYCSTAYNSAQIQMYSFALGNSSNHLSFYVTGGVGLWWDGQGYLQAGYGASGNLGGNGGWWKGLNMGSGNTYSTWIVPPASPSASNTLTEPADSGTLLVGAGSVGKATCWKTTTGTVGYCSTVVASDGSCTCN